MLELQAQPYDIVIRDAPQPRSSDLSEQTIYAHTITIGEYRFVNKVMEVYYQGQILSSCLFSSYFGVDARVHSAVTINHICYIAVAQFLLALELPQLTVQWQAAVDPSVCFGVYLLPDADGLITHVEQDIARVSFDGIICWSISGRDIFSNDIVVESEHITVVDFQGDRYHIDNVTGESRIMGSKKHLFS